jgi:hypothetical protein
VPAGTRDAVPISIKAEVELRGKTKIQSIIINKLSELDRRMGSNGAHNASSTIGRTGFESLFQKCGQQTNQGGPLFLKRMPARKRW